MYRNNSRKKYVLNIFLLLFVQRLLFAQSTTHYPKVNSLESKKANVIFRQFLDDVSNNYKAMAAGLPFQTAFYCYEVQNDETLFTLSSRCSLPIETIALINHIPSADTSLQGKILILPTCAGLYIAAQPSNFIETLLFTRFEGSLAELISCAGESFFFLPNERLSGTERLYFLDSRLKSPLQQSVLTSAFGERISPITGKEKFHKGIDLAAAEGSPVYACLSGKVSFCGYDAIYGNYVILTHDNNLQSLYAHLQSATVKENMTVASGSVIGFVGLTGLTTGPHLHFEVHQNGVPLNPEDFFAE